MRKSRHLPKQRQSLYQEYLNASTFTFVPVDEGFLVPSTLTCIL